MMLRKKNRNQSSNNFVAKTPDVDFVNYATHFNRKTILTKNGELLQIIRITGLNKDGDKEEQISLRDKIRDAIYDNTEDENKFAFWFHTIRRKKNVTTRMSDNYENFLSKKINEQWNKENDWQNQYVNELYISIISQSASYLQSRTSKSFSGAFSYKTATKQHISNLKILERDLSEFTNKIQLELIESGAKILGIEEWQGQYFSEPLRFLGKIINLKEDRYPLTFNDISKDLTSSRIVFGSRDVQVINDKKNHFCAILSLKEYTEVPLELMDKILNLNFEFIITQSFDFFRDENQLKNYQENLDILEISQDRALKEISGLSEYEDYDKKPEKEFGSLQTTITIITDNHEKLEEEIADALEEFGTLGLIMIREDVFLEHCYWSRLPGNFNFLKRQKTIKTLKVPGFSAINSFPTGSFDGNRWGPAITTLKTIIDTPYFFNFHTFDSGNTIIQGPQSSSKNLFTNFLITQATKLDCNIYFIDSHNSNKALVKCLEGDYYTFGPNSKGSDKAKLNPFKLEASKDSVIFIQSLLSSMTRFLKGTDVEDEIIKAQDVILELLKIKSPDFLVAFDTLRANESKNLYEKLKIWANGKLSYVFDSQEELEWGKKITGFDFSEIIKQKPIVIPIFQYLIYKIHSQAKKTGKPTIIVIDEPIEFLNNPVFEDQFPNLCKSSFESNSILVLKNSNELSNKNSKLTKEFFENCNTQIIYPSEKEKEDYNEETFFLDEGELEALSYMTLNDQENILIKKEGIPIIIKPETKYLDEYKAILSCDPVAKFSIDEIINSNPEIIKNPKSMVEEVTNIVNEFKKAEEEEVKLKIEKQLKESKRINDEE